MASVSKNINKLVSNSESDLTAELELPELEPEDAEAADHAVEADADTSEFSQADIQAEFQDIANAEAKPDALSRTGSLDRLQFDIEQLRAEWAGLEQELSDRFNGEIQALNDQLKSSQQDLAGRQQKLDSVQEQLEQANERAKRFADEVEQIRKDAKNDAKQNNSRIHALEKQLAAAEKQIASVESKLQESEIRRQKSNEKSESRGRQLTEFKKQLSESQSALSDLRKESDARQKTWKQVDDELSRVKASLAESEYEVENLSDAVKKRDADFERGQAKISELSNELDAQLKENKKLKSENRELRRIARNDAAQELERSHKLIAEQSGRLTGNEQEISALKAQIERTERYADELRYQLREQSGIAESAVAERQDLVTARDAAQDKAAELIEELTRFRRENAKLTTRLGEVEKNFEEEIRRVSFELSQAQDTIADQDTINVHLTSDLFNTKGFQTGLETELEETRAHYEDRIQELEQQANKLRNQLDDYEYKLENKDEAITALMNELANRGEAEESVDEIHDVISEIEKVIDEIDQRIPEEVEEHDESNGRDRERVTRLLIGENEGQELRFPLFKDRLTIGRTAHNDIQLDTKFISRQHAVIVTESGSTKIVDWGSKNGVLVNEKRVSEQVLENGDIVTIGTTDFRYEERPKR